MLDNKTYAIGGWNNTLSLVSANNEKYDPATKNPLLLSNHLNNNIPTSSSIIKINKDNLLPGTQGEIAFYQGDRYRRFEECRSNMRKTIAVTPSLIML